MAWFGKIILIVSLGLLVIGLQHSFAIPSLAISTSKQTYEYGDHLSLIFEVSELTGDSVTIQIIDGAGKASSPIPITITNLKTEITAPDAFYKTTFKPGTYHIDATYSGTNSSTIFTLIDSDKIAIPSYDKNIFKLWSDGKQYTDVSFANVIRELVQYDIIHISNLNNQTTNTIHIPSWVKNDAIWWSNDLISDNDFALGLQYLIESKIIIV